MVLVSTSTPEVKRSLRVAVDLSTMLPGGENGGVKPFALETIKALVKQEAKEVSFLYLTWSKSHDEVVSIARSIDKVLCVRNDDSSLNKKAVLNTSFDLLLAYQIDLLYSPFSCSDYACPGIPLVTTVVDLLHKDYPLSLKPNQVETRELNFQYLLKATSVFQCISEYTAKQLQFHYGVSKQVCIVTPIAIQKRLKVMESEAEIKRVFPYFLYPANAWAHKNHNTLLLAYRLYLKREPKGWDLVLTGHLDQGMQSLKETARALGIESKVKFLGHIANEQFASLWKKAGCLVFPSLHEGFGIPLVEAMYFGIPIVCSKEGSLPEVALDAAYYVDCKDPVSLAESLKRITQDEALRNDLIKKGYKRLNAFKIEESTELLLQTFLRCKENAGHLYSRGIYKDLWTSEKAAIALPKLDEVSEVRITLAAISEERRIRLYRGSIPYGGYLLKANEARIVSVSMRCDGLPLILEIIDARKLGIMDSRKLGVLLESVVLKKADGTELKLEHLGS